MCDFSKKDAVVWSGQLMKKLVYIYTVFKPWPNKRSKFCSFAIVLSCSMLRRLEKHNYKLIEKCLPIQIYQNDDTRRKNVLSFFPM